MDRLPNSPACAAAPITDRTWDAWCGFVARLRAKEMPGWAWVVLLWAVFAFPAFTLRAAHFEEGTVIGLARGAFEEGHWLSPYLYGARFVERPVLLSWIIAAAAPLFGGVGVIGARLPHLLFLLGGGLLVFNLVKPLTRKAPAVFGALCWFACPMIGQKFITAEPDVTLSTLLFAGFFVWWKGESRGRVSLARWLAVGLLLALAGLTKGPQPIAYFTLGVGAYLLIRQRWHELPGFVFANLVGGLLVAAWYVAVAVPGDVEGWKAHSRLLEGLSLQQWLRDHADFLVSIVVEFLPGSLLLAPAVLALARKSASIPLRDHDLVLAVVLYASLGTLALLVWPGGIATRYAMPANLALAVLSGLLFEAWWSSHPRLVGAGNTIVGAIAAYLVVIGWIAMPLAPDAFRQTRIAGQTIDAVRTLLPGPFYVSAGIANVNVLAYVAAPVRVATLPEIAQTKTPALALLGPADAAALAALNPDLVLIAHAALKGRDRATVFEIRSR